MKTKAYLDTGLWSPDICYNRDGKGCCCCSPHPRYFYPPSTPDPPTPIVSYFPAHFTHANTTGFGNIQDVADARRARLAREKAANLNSTRLINAQNARQNKEQAKTPPVPSPKMTEAERHYWMKVYPLEKKGIDDEKERIAKENGTWVQPRMTYSEIMKAEAELNVNPAPGFVQQLKNPVDTLKSLMNVSKKTQLTQAPLANTRIPGG